MTNTENRFKHDGIWYERAEIIDDLSTCSGCSGERNRKLCRDAPTCIARERKDNRKVIFVKSDADNQGGEE